MALKLITAPAEEPVSIAEAAVHLRVDSDYETALIQALITVARQEAEKITRRSLMPQTWQLSLDSFPAEINPPLPELQSVTSIKYDDADGVEQTLGNTLYQVDTDSLPARIVPAYGQSWPSTRNQLNAVRIEYIAGYSDAEAVPKAIKQWILIRVATLFENREGVNIGNIVNTIPFVDGLLDEYRVLTF